MSTKPASRLPPRALLRRSIMDVQISRLDLKKTAAHWPTDMPFAPALLVKQPTTSPGAWLVVDAPLVPDQPLCIAQARGDQYVRIPLFSYDFSGQADTAFAQMLALGLTCAGQCAGKMKKVHIVTGNPVDLLYADDITTVAGLRYWFGFAFITE